MFWNIGAQTLVAKNFRNEEGDARHNTIIFIKDEAREWNDIKSCSLILIKHIVQNHKINLVFIISSLLLLAQSLQHTHKFKTVNIEKESVGYTRLNIHSYIWSSETISGLPIKLCDISIWWVRSSYEVEADWWASTNF